MWIEYAVLFSIQIIMTMESPHENMKQCVCVCIGGFANMNSLRSWICKLFWMPVPIRRNS